MARPTRHDITIVIGDDFRDFESVIRKLDGDVVNVSGYSYTMQVRPSADSSTTLATMSMSIIDGANGEFGGTLTDTTTDTLPPMKSAAYSLKETTAGGIETTLLEGDVEIRKVATP